ncbi:MAG TPA: ABC transporter substrate-binding protein [Beijerinckiaceae bacterium]|nr:ABC transporter substrate-binding protein [Beijerinckiaceae bacterium]
MRRRTLFGLVLFLLQSTPALAQSSPVRRIGFLGNSTADLERHLLAAFRDGLREWGYVEGRNIAVAYRWAEGQYDRFPGLIDELIASGAELIATAGTPASQAVTQHAPTTPLVMIAVGDPVGTGLAASLARPGGRATGLTSIAPDLEGKRLELIREVLPKLSRLAVFWNPGNAYQIRDEEEVRAAAKQFRIDLLSIPIGSAYDLRDAFGAIDRGGAHGLLVLADRLFLHNRHQIIAFAGDARLPVVSAYRELVEAGGLMSFGPSYTGMHRQAARYVDKILKGADPAELPIEQPARFELVINRKTAARLGVSLGAAILARADEVIE